MNGKNERFNPVEEVDEILDKLREIKLGWIADEIIDIIQMGKTIEKKYPNEYDMRKKEKSASTIVPFSKNEQIHITLKALYNYFIDLSDIWDSSFKNLQIELQKQDFRISILYPESEKEVELYKPTFPDFKDHFKKLLLEGLNIYKNNDAKEVY